MGEAAHPGPTRRLRRVGDERNVARRLSTQATVVDSSVSDDEMPLLRGFTGPQDHGHVDPTLLDSLAEDLGVCEPDNEVSRGTIHEGGSSCSVSRLRRSGG